VFDGDVTSQQDDRGMWITAVDASQQFTTEAGGVPTDNECSATFAPIYWPEHGGDIGNKLGEITQLLELVLEIGGVGRVVCETENSRHALVNGVKSLLCFTGGGHRITNGENNVADNVVSTNPHTGFRCA
jgi:hypothetical protein